jgi:hypothetical protein
VVSREQQSDSAQQQPTQNSSNKNNANDESAKPKTGENEIDSVRDNIAPRDGTLSTSTANLDVIQHHQKASGEDGKEKEAASDSSNQSSTNSKQNPTNASNTESTALHSSGLGRLSPRGLSPRSRSEKFGSNDRRSVRERTHTTDATESPLRREGSFGGQRDKAKSKSPSARDLASQQPTDLFNDPFIKHVRSVSVSTPKDATETSQLLLLSPSKPNIPTATLDSPKSNATDSNAVNSTSTTTTTMTTITTSAPPPNNLRTSATTIHRKASAPVLYQASLGTGLSPRSGNPRIQTTPRSPRTLANSPTGEREKLTIPASMTILLPALPANPPMPTNNVTNSSPPMSPSRAPHSFVSNSHAASPGDRVNNNNSEGGGSHPLQKTFSMPQLKWTNAANPNPNNTRERRCVVVVVVVAVVVVVVVVVVVDNVAVSIIIIVVVIAAAAVVVVVVC